MQRAEKDREAPGLRQTSGATTALIVRYVRSKLGDEGVERLLDLAGETRAPEILEDETSWSTYAQKIALFDAAARVLDDPSVASHIGRTVLEHRVGLPVKLLLKTLGSPGQVFRNIARATPKFSTVATMSAPEVLDSSAIVTYRLGEGLQPSRYDCDYNTGLLSQAPVLFGMPPATITHPHCQVDGAPECTYEIRWHPPQRMGRRKSGVRRSTANDDLSTLTDRYEALQSSVGDLVSDEDLETVLGRIANRAAHCVRAEAHVLAVTPVEGQDLRLLHEGMAEEDARELADAARDKRPLAGIGVLSVEIASARRHYGHLIALYNSDHPFFDEEQRLLEAFAHHAAAALDAATALDAARTEAATSNALLRLARSFANARSDSEMAQSLAEELPGLAGGGQALVHLWDTEAEVLRTVGVHGFSPEERDALFGRTFGFEDTPEVKFLVEQQEPRRYRRDNADSFVLATMEAFGSTEVFVVPVSARGRFLGVLLVSRREGDPPLVHESLLRSRLEGLADQTGSGLERLELLNKLTDTVGSLRGEVAERHKTEIELRAAEAQIRELFTGIPVALYRVGADGTILDANPALAAVLGLDDVGSLIGRSAFDFYVDKRDVQNFRDLMSKNDVVRDAEARLRRTDGSIVTVSETARAVHDDEGRLVYFEGAMEDITQQKLAFEERERLERQLMQAQRLDAVGRLAGGIAHDFNNLLAVITNFAGFLLEELPEEDQRRGDAMEIRKAADRGARLVKQLLAFSRKEESSPEVLDLNAAVFDTEKLLRRTLGEDIDLEVRADPELWRTKADRGQIQQIILNLAVNARDAMPNGGELVISTENEPVEDVGPRELTMPPGRYVRLAMTDTGCGMSEDVKAQIFEPFFTTKGRGAGTGLGLAMVYGLVKQAGGYIWVDSEPDRGSTMTIHLPATSEDLAGPQAATPLEGVEGKGETVLLVEDEDAVRRLVERILLRAGYRVVAAASGEEALNSEVGTTGEFDVLLTDVIMPRVSGRELYDRLHDLNYDFKTVFMSGYTDQIVARHGVLEEGCEFLQKPFTGETVLEAIRKVLTPART